MPNDAVARARQGRGTLFRPLGDLDAYTVFQLRRVLSSLASAPRLVIDLAASVSWITGPGDRG